jgi:L-alanine-DL-glutamate epimerase-like enolase superfamily enzyme
MQLSAVIQRWPLREPFTISRRTFVDSLTVTVCLHDADGHTGLGECEPHEWDAEVAHHLLAEHRLTHPGADNGHPPSWLRGLERENLASLLPNTPLRNAIDCALWDMDAKRLGRRAWTLAGWDDVAQRTVPVVPTIGLGTPQAMESQAQSLKAPHWVKLKLGAADGLDPERLEAVAGALRNSRLLVDANGGWTPATLKAMLPLAQRLGVCVIEQPLPPALDSAMPAAPSGILFCADESCLDSASLPAVRQHFQWINIKLDKCGGLSEALALREAAQDQGMGVMVGSNGGTSLAMAPAFVLAQGLEIVDLAVDHLLRDREPSLHIEGHVMHEPSRELWG